MRVIAIHGLLSVSMIVGMGCGKDAKREESLVSNDKSSRTWRSDQHNFEVNVPSERWDEIPNANVLVRFGASDLAATVAEARPAETDSEWQSALRFAKRRSEGKPTANTEEKSGTNQNGHEHWLFVGDVGNGANGYFLGISITRVRGKAVIMMFEGNSKQSADQAAFQRSQAQSFLSSVK